jgi:hypothetical protein
MPTAASILQRGDRHEGRRTDPVHTQIRRRIDRQQLLLKRARAREVQSYSVPCWTIETLLANSGIDATTIDLLQVDTEGNDYDIIQSIDYRHMKPTIVRYEHLLMSRRQKNACLALLASHSYRFIVEENDTLALLAP